MLAVVAVLATVSVPLYAAPSMQAPRDADVAVVLGPPTTRRQQWARQLADEGRVGAVLVSVPDPSTDPACRQDWPVPVVCFRPDPFTTRGEARYLRDAMAVHGWATALVITSTPHVTRTRYVMGRCLPTGVQVVGRAPGATPWWWAYQYLYQTAGWVKALAQDGC